MHEYKIEDTKCIYIYIYLIYLSHLKSFTQEELRRSMTSHVWLKEVLGKGFDPTRWWHSTQGLVGVYRAHDNEIFLLKGGITIPNIRSFQAIDGGNSNISFIFTPMFGEDSHVAEHIFQMGFATTN